MDERNHEIKDGKKLRHNTGKGIRARYEEEGNCNMNKRQKRRKK
jgi:hypothetical protein